MAKKALREIEALKAREQELLRQPPSAERGFALVQVRHDLADAWERRHAEKREEGERFPAADPEQRGVDRLMRTHETRPMDDDGRPL